MTNETNMKRDTAMIINKIRGRAFRICWGLYKNL